MPWDAGQAVGVASSLTLTNGRTVRSAVTVVSKGRGRAMDAQTRRRNRSPSMQAASGSGVTGRRAGQEQQRRPLATRAGPSGVQPVFVRPEENSDRLEGELFGLERDEDQGHPSAVDFGVVAGGPSPGQPVLQVLGVGTRCRAAWGHLSRLDVEHCLGNAAWWIQRSVSTATWDAYSKVWQE